MIPKLTTYRLRIAWLDWLNYTQWSEWFSVVGMGGVCMGNGVPQCVVNATQSGFMLDEHDRMPVNIGVIRLSDRTQGRYIPAHRITAVDWEIVPDA